MNPNGINQKIQKRVLKELKTIESKTTDKNILKSISNIREIFKN